jgi:replicative DNA helicase
MSEAEMNIVGAAMIDHSLALTLPVNADDFENEFHGRLWVLMGEAANSGRIITLDQIQTSWPNMHGYVRAIVDNCMTHPDTVKSYARAVKDAAARRRLKYLAMDLAESVGDIETPVEELAAKFVSDITKATGAAGARMKREVAASVVTALDKPSPCYSTGLPRLDEVWGGGLFAGKLYGIAARKKVGKSALLATVSQALNRSATKHLFVALEMSPEEIEQRHIATEYNFNSVKFLKRQDRGIVIPSSEYAANVPDNTIYEHRPGASLEEIRRMVTRAILHHKISGVILDYWQLVGGKAKSETEEFHLRNVAQWFADICRREGIWCLMAAQLNQEGNTRSGEGLKLACDIYMTLNREKDSEGAWMEMQESRYVLYNDVGSETMPGLFLNKNGPHFEDAMARREPPRRWDDQ